MKSTKLLCALFLLLILFPAWAAFAFASPSRATATAAPVIPEPTLQLVGHEGGALRAMAVQGQYAYLGLGPQLAILDLSDPNAPQRVGQHLLSAAINAIEIDGDYAYLATSNGLTIVDMRNPSQPVPVAYMAGERLYDLAINGSYAYVMQAGGEDAIGQLLVVDISDSRRPRPLGHHPVFRPGELAFIDGYAYIISLGPDYGGELKIIDLRDPASPVEVGAVQLEEYATPLSLLAANEHLYLLGYAYDGPYMKSCLFILNASTPATPQEEYSECRSTSSYYVQGHNLALLDDYLYIAGPGLRVLDVSDPADPEGQPLEATGPASQTISDVLVTDNYFYARVGNSQFTIFQKPSPTSLNQQGSFKTISYAADIAIAEDYAYLADSGAEGLRVLDVATPSVPRLVGSLRLNHHAASGITTEGERAYIVGSWHGIIGRSLGNSTSLTIATVENPAEPAVIGSIASSPWMNTNPCNPGKAVAIAQHYIYMEYDCAGRVINVSDPVSPKIDETSSGTLLTDVVVQEPYAYRTSRLNYDWAFQTLDISQPNAPQLLGSIEFPFALQALAISDTIAYVAPSQGGLEVIDISDPATPSRISSLPSMDPNERATSMAAWGPYALVTGTRGLLVYDVSDPTEPRLVDAYKSVYRAESVAVDDDGYIYLADGAAGVRVFRLASLYHQHLPFLYQSP